MSDNSSQILNYVLSQMRQELFSEISEQDYFEFFCAEQILKDFGLSYDEIQSEIVDGEHDGGVDSVYTFVNGELIYEDFDTSHLKKDVTLELYLIQSKTAAGFSEAPINKLISLARHLLKLDADYAQLTQYNEAVKSSLDNFRIAYRSLASKFPNLKIGYYYAAKRADSQIHENILLKSQELKQITRELFQESEVHFEFLGARKLLELARRRPKITFDLRVSKSFSAVNGHVVLSTLSDYYRFLCDGGDKVIAGLFESNVRDSQGDTEVNAEIGNTLRNENNVEFWWMNNGVTILASRATLNGDTVTIENPQIVNGLQTSTQIAQYFQSSNKIDTRNIMVKIVSSENEEVRDKIIKATNSQNAVRNCSPPLLSVKSRLTRSRPGRFTTMYGSRNSSHPVPQ